MLHLHAFKKHSNYLHVIHEITCFQKTMTPRKIFRKSEYIYSKLSNALSLELILNHLKPFKLDSIYQKRISKYISHLIMVK